MHDYFIETERLILRPLKIMAEAASGGLAIICDMIVGGTVLLLKQLKQ